METLNLSVEENDELVIGDEGLAGNIEDVDLCLVGRFLTEQSLNFAITKSRLVSIWKPQRGILFKEVGEIYLQVSLNSLAFWAQIYDLPMGLFSEGVGCAIGNFISKLLEYDVTNKGATWKTYMRIQVEVDVSQPLKRFKKVKLAEGRGEFYCGREVEHFLLYLWKGVDNWFRSGMAAGEGDSDGERGRVFNDNADLLKLSLICLKNAFRKTLAIFLSIAESVAEVQISY
ncbi:hypothetical protein ACS0TY_027595 [Phlomoides rotata]